MKINKITTSKKITLMWVETCPFLLEVETLSSSAEATEVTNVHFTVISEDIMPILNQYHVNRMVSIYFWFYYPDFYFFYKKKSSFKYFKDLNFL